MCVADVARRTADVARRTASRSTRAMQRGSMTRREARGREYGAAWVTRTLFVRNKV